MLNLQERAQELLNERNQLVTRVAEINGALQELDQIAKAASEENPTEEEDNG
tara:strand:- start:311 stop:466 length:156 start_codon:yes stop_codon:yes gene_type:complete